MANQKLNFLLVEDDPAHAEAVRRSILAGFPKARVKIAGALEEYRRLAKTERPDLAILDMNLPDGRAMEALTAPAEEGPFPVIVMTSQGDEKIAVEALKAGALDYLVKSPEAFDSMPRTVERTLENWATLQDRRQAERSLRQSEERYRTLFERLGDYALVLEPDAAGIPVIVDMNEAALRVHGYTRDELIGKPVSLLEPEITLEINAERARLVEKTGVCSFNVRHRTKDGRLIELEAVAQSVMINGRKQFLCVERDVTERNRLQERLREREILFSALLENSPIYVFFKDREIRALSLSSNYEQMLGIPVEKAIGKTMDELFPSELALKMVEDDRRVLEKGELIKVEEEFGGRFYETIKFPIFKDGQPYMLAGFTIDITSRKNMENALAESEQKYRLMAENISDVFWIATPDISKMIYVSPAYEKVWGRSCQSLYESPGSFIEAIHPEDRERATSEFRQARERETTWITHYRIVRPDGSVRWIEDRGFPVYDEQGHFYLNTGVSEDITLRKLAEEKLSQSERKFRTVFRDSPVGLELYDSDGILIDANGACLDIFGLSDVQQALGFKLFDDPNMPEEARVRLRSGKPASYEVVFDFERVRERNLYQTAKKGNIDIHTIIAPLGWDGTKASGGYLAQVADVTEHHQLEQEREATLNILHLLNSAYNRTDLMESVLLCMKNWSGCEAVGIRLKEGDDYPYYVTSGFDDAFVKAESGLCARDSQGSILRDKNCNPVLDCMCGNVIQGRFDPSLPFFTENGSFWTNCTTELLASTSEADRQSRTRNRCNGEGYESVAMVPLRFGKETFGLLQMNDRRRDCFTKEKIRIFERLAGNLAIGLAQRKSIQELRFSRERLNFVIEGARLGWWDWDIRTGKVTRSQVWADMLGYTIEEAQEPELFNKIIHPEDKAWSDRIVIRHLEGHTPDFEYEARIRRKAGDYIWVLSRGRVVERDAEGGPLRASGTIQDITSQKQLEEERAKASRLESVGLLAGGIAHDFNNILTTVLGNITLGRMMLKDEPAGAIGILAEAESAIMKSQGLTRQLLTFSKGGEPVKKLFCLKTVVTETTLFALRGSKIKAVFDLPEDPCLVEADEGQVSQVFNNLVINALQAMPDGGKLEVHVSRETVGTGKELKLEPGDYIRVEIRDYGIGISPEHLSKIFDPYFTTKQKGSGLGLTASYSIVKRHGGRIEVESTLGAGTLFRVYLPASTKPLEENAKNPAEKHFIPGRILLMDDEEAIRSMVAAMLKRMGHEVVAASHGEEAVTLYSQALEAGRRFDAVILDLTVPGGLGGKETIKILKKMDPNVKAVVSSGYSADDICARPREYGFFDSVSKPFTMQDLKAVLIRILESEP